MANSLKARVFLLFILPIFLLYFWLFPFNERIELLNATGPGNELHFYVSPAVEPSFKEAIRQIFNVPFDLKWYNVCFEDRGSTISQEVEDFSWVVNFNGEKNLTVNRSSRTCTLIQSNEMFTTPNWYITVQLQYRPDMQEVVLDAVQKIHDARTAYAQPEPWSLVVKYGLFLIAWWSVCLLLREILRFIQNRPVLEG